LIISFWKSILFEYIYSLANRYSVFPIFSSHFINSFFKHCRTILSIHQRVILCFDIHVELGLIKKWQNLMIKYVHWIADTPNISCLTWKSIIALELMLRPSKSRCACRKEWNIISVIPNRSKIDYFYLISEIWCLSTQNIVNLHVSIGDIFIVKVFYSFTNLQKDYSCYISKIICSIFCWNILNNLRVSVVSKV